MPTKNKIFDLRSDTVTKPCQEMLRAMTSASFGDDYYQEDKDTKVLEEFCCDFFGVEDAVFMVSGTMANQIAIRCATKSGSQIICDKFSHIVYHCGQGAADLGKIFFNVIDTGTGVLTRDDIKKAISSTYCNYAPDRPLLIWVENTIGHYGGGIFPLHRLEEIFWFSQKQNMHLHLDGARLLNACAATKTSARNYVKYSDTTTFSFSKGLGAPFGSVLLGSRKNAIKARMFRKWYGGGMHQSGLLAAACLYALQNNVPALLEDNQNAKLLADIVLKGQDHVFVQSSIESNIVMFDFSKSHISAKYFIRRAKEEGVLLFHWSSNCVRAVTHKDLSRDDITLAGKILNKIVTSFE